MPFLTTRITRTRMHLLSSAVSLAALAAISAPTTNAAPSMQLTPAQTRAINDAVLAAHRSGKNVRGLLDNIFGGDSNASDGYAPYNVTCPTDITWVRNASSVGSVEQDYVNRRASQLSSAWNTQISNVGLQAPPRTPVVAMALSGGGYRAMISGSGQAFQPNTTSGSVGDILGLSTYVSGLSGGSWAVGTFYANNGQNPDQLAQNVSVTALDLEGRLIYMAFLCRSGTLTPIWSFPLTTNSPSTTTSSPKLETRRTRASARKSPTTGD